MTVGHPRSISSYLKRLLSRGRLVFCSADMQRDLGIGPLAINAAAESQMRQGRLIRAGQDVYVIVPPEYRELGTPPPSDYIDTLMAHWKRPYYVGLKTAARWHGGPVQRSVEFHVVTDRRLAPVDAGCLRLVFFPRVRFQSCAPGVLKRTADAGRLNFSGIELTVFDLVQHTAAAGGIAGVVPDLFDLGRRVDANTLAAVSVAFERSVGQRLGYLLERLGHHAPAQHLHDVLTQRGPLQWTDLEPMTDVAGGMLRADRNDRWRVKALGDLSSEAMDAR